MSEERQGGVVDETLLCRLGARLGAEQRERRLPSVVAGLVRGGALVWSDGRGDVPGPVALTQYRIGSISKTFVAVAVLRLRDEGRLRLSDAIGRFVPDAPSGEASIAQVLSHASGIRAETTGPWWERTAGPGWDDLRDAISDSATVQEPGRRFHYSNVGFAVLGELVGRARASSWEQVVRDEILQPLEMTRTTMRPLAPHADGLAVHPWADVVLPEPEHDAGAMAPAGQLWSSVADMARWAAFLGGDTGDVLSADTLAEMRQPLSLDDRPGEPWTQAFGLGLQVWNTEGRRLVGHSGSMPGFVALVQVDPDTHDGVVAMANSTTGFARSLPSGLLSALDEVPREDESWRPSPVEPDLLAIAGPWYWGPAPFELRIKPDGWLELAAAGEGRGSRFRPAGDHTWLGLDGYFADETLRVVRGTEGHPPHLDLGSFVFTRLPYDAGAEIPGGVHPEGWR